MLHPKVGTPLLCGIDEVGRGPLAGPVTAAAIVIPNRFDRNTLRDSKKLSEQARLRIERTLIDSGAWFRLGWAWPHEIDTVNILNASLLAMTRAWRSLWYDLSSTSGVSESSVEVIVDGIHCPSIAPPCRAVIKGDATVPVVMAASIVAKNARDRWMIRYAERDPRYGFDRHKGYPTADHKQALHIYGPSVIHRRSFRGVLPR